MLGIVFVITEDPQRLMQRRFADARRRCLSGSRWFHTQVRFEISQLLIVGGIIVAEVFYQTQDQSLEVELRIAELDPAIRVVIAAARVPADVRVTFIGRAEIPDDVRGTAPTVNKNDGEKCWHALLLWRCENNVSCFGSASSLGPLHLYFARASVDISLRVDQALPWHRPPSAD